MSDPKQSLDQVMQDLESQGVTMENYKDKDGLGDLVEQTLSKFGITEDKVQEWFGIKGCGCQKRKKFLNSVLSFLKK